MKIKYFVIASILAVITMAITFIATANTLVCFGVGLAPMQILFGLSLAYNAARAIVYNLQLLNIRFINTCAELMKDEAMPNWKFRILVHLKLIRDGFAFAGIHFLMLSTIDMNFDMAMAMIGFFLIVSGLIFYCGFYQLLKYFLRKNVFRMN